MELGNMIFGNSRGSFEVPRKQKWVDPLHELLERAGLSGYGWPEGDDSISENDVFVVRPYYWGECECGYEEREWQWCGDNRHSPECYQSEKGKRFTKAKLLPESWEGGIDWPYAARQREESKILKKLCEERGLPYPNGCAVHCDCDYQKKWEKWASENTHAPDCPIVLPNFQHKPSGFEVQWYKYPLRDSYMNKDVSVEEWTAIFKECTESLTPSTVKG